MSRTHSLIASLAQLLHTLQSPLPCELQLVRDGGNGDQLHLGQFLEHLSVAFLVEERGILQLFLDLGLAPLHASRDRYLLLALGR